MARYSSRMLPDDDAMYVVENQEAWDGVEDPNVPVLDRPRSKYMSRRELVQRILVRPRALEPPLYTWRKFNHLLLETPYSAARVSLVAAPSSSSSVGTLRPSRAVPSRMRPDRAPDQEDFDQPETRVFLRSDRLLRREQWVAVAPRVYESLPDNNYFVTGRHADARGRRSYYFFREGITTILHRMVQFLVCQRRVQLRREGGLCLYADGEAALASSLGGAQTRQSLSPPLGTEFLYGLGRDTERNVRHLLFDTRHVYTLCDWLARLGIRVWFVKDDARRALARFTPSRLFGRPLCSADENINATTQ